MSQMHIAPELLAASVVADPLYQVQHDPRMAQIGAEHIEMIARRLPRQAEFARTLLAPLSDNLHSPLPFLTSLVVLREQLMNGEYGTMAPMAAVRMPLSVLAEVNGTMQRYLTPAIALARQSWLTIDMAQKNRQQLQAIYATFGVDVVTTCCCGIVMTAAGMGQTVLNSELVKLQDHVRSAADRLAVPVHHVSSLRAIPGENAEITPHEATSFALLENLLNEMATVQIQPDEATILADFRRLRAVTGTAAAL